MAYQDNISILTELLEQEAEQGLDFLPELTHITINTAMQIEYLTHQGQELPAQGKRQAGLLRRPSIGLGQEQEVPAS